MRVMSQNTSISSINRVYKEIIDRYPKGTRILDYGCGRYDNNKNWAEEHGFEWFGYDPGWKTEEENKAALNCKPDIIIYSNVLNVVDDELMFEILLHIDKFNVPVYYTIYEGNKSGIKKETIKGYQRNERTDDYIGLFEMLYEKVSKTGNIVYCCH